MAGKTTRGTRTQATTSMADLGSVVRLNFHNFNAYSFSFVLDKTLQLKKTPVANPIIKPLSSPLLSYSFEVFHYNLVSIKDGNNPLAYVVVNPSHEPLLSTRDFPEQSLGTLSAFGLKFSTNELKLSFDLLDFGRIKELAVGSDSKIVYSEVNAKNSVLRSIAQSIDFFGKGKQEKASSFSIDSQEAFFNIPNKIFFVAFRNAEWNLNTTFDSSEAQNIILEGSRTRKIVSHGSIFDDRFGFSFFDHFNSLPAAADDELGLKFSLFEVAVDSILELDFVFDIVFPGKVNTILQGFAVGFESLDYQRISWDFDFSCYNASHAEQEEGILYKSYAGMSSGIGGWQFLPYLKIGVSLPYTL